jgi:hypothetical protein
MKWLKVLIAIVALLGVVYFVGPHPDKPVFDYAIQDIPEGTNLDSLVKSNEAVHKIKPDILQGWMYHSNLIVSLLKYTFILVFITKTNNIYITIIYSFFYINN